MCIFVSSGFFRRFDKIPAVFCAELLNSRGLQIYPYVPDIGKMELPNQFDKDCVATAARRRRPPADDWLRQGGS
jgi:hypothetical protein